MNAGETICAIATGIGGAVSVIRISGPEAESVCSGLWRSLAGAELSALPPRMLVLGSVRSKEKGVLDPSCLAVRMPAPNSFTGENVVELHCHGGALCTRAVLAALLEAGARSAEPGEFSKRAFLNGKIDLVQAEAIADLISAGSDAALTVAGNQLDGVLGRRIRSSQEALQGILAEVESRLDFPEEDLDWKPEAELREVIGGVREDIDRLAATRAGGELLRGGVTLVIAGPPNAGKSTLLNRMLGRDRAIVSEIPGTTRDTIEATVQIHGIPFHLVDTAGIRDGSADAIENAGMERTRRCAENARLVVWLMDATRPEQEQAFPGWKLRGTLLTIANKCDAASARIPSEALSVSALTGDGIEALYAAMKESVLPGESSPEASEIAVAARHADLLQQAAAHLETALPRLEAGDWELLAFDLREAIAALRRITGETVPYDVLDTIFSTFCIGK